MKETAKTRLQKLLVQLIFKQTVEPKQILELNKLINEINRQAYAEGYKDGKIEGFSEGYDIAKQI
jgi:flagellar biosynthesis/type III secretory pathway protein FliH